jgi:hypothetical protein
MTKGQAWILIAVVIAGLCSLARLLYLQSLPAGHCETFFSSGSNLCLVVKGLSTEQQAQIDAIGKH